MSGARQVPAKTYFVIFGWLIVLTVLEVGLTLLGWPKLALATMLIASALAKALLIALFFMHLRFDRAAVWLLPGIPILLGFFFVGMLFPDIAFHLTGH